MKKLMQMLSGFMMVAGIVLCAGTASASIVSTQYMNSQLANKVNTDTVGNLGTLTTSEKTTLVGAINEVNGAAVKGFTDSGSGYVVTGVTGKGTVTRGNVQIPVGSATATTYAQIWVE